MGVVDAKLDRVHARERCSLVHRQFTRKVLLELPRRTHAVIAEADRERRSFLPHLKCAMTALDHIRNLSVNPRIGNVVDRGTYEICVDLWSWHGGKTRDDRAHRPIILHGRHVVVDFVRHDLAFVVDRNLNIGEASR